MGKRLLIFLSLSILLPVAQVTRAETVTKTVSGKTVFSFAGGAVKFVLVPFAGSGTVSIEFTEVGPNQGGQNTPKTLLDSINLSATCITRTGSKKCPVFVVTGGQGLTPPFDAGVFYSTDDPLGINPRLCRFVAAGNGDCTLTGYYPFVPNSGGDPGIVRTSDGVSTWFVATLAIDPGAAGVATILDPVGNNTTITQPNKANGGSVVPLKVLLCRGQTLDPCSPITDAQILVSIARVDPDFAIVLPLRFPGSSTPPPIMEFLPSSGWYQFNWRTPEIPGLYNVSFTFLTSNFHVLTAWVRVPTP